MNLLLSTNYVIWLPVYELNNPAYMSLNYWIFSIVYMLLLSISAYFTILLVVISWRVRKFHRNMTICFCAGFGAWFECWLGVVLIWPYKCGLVLIDDSNLHYHNFELSNISEMPKVSNISESTCLLIGSLLIWHYLSSTVAGMANFVIERSIASFFFSDYEKIDRSYIGYGILIASQLCVFQCSILLFFYIFDLKFALLISIFTLSCVVLSFFFLLHYNTTLRNQLDIKHVNVSYNLAARFQAAENARSLKLAIFVFSVICCIFAAAISMLMILFLKLVPDDYNFIIMTAFECLMALNPLFIVPSAMFSVAEWKVEFCKFLPFLRGKRRRRRRSRDVKMGNEMRLSMETDLYFVQLGNSWNTSVHVTSV